MGEAIPDLSAAWPGCAGVEWDDFPTYLAAHEFGYNHRDEHPLSTLFDRLDKSGRIKGLLSWKIPDHRQ